MDVTSFLGNVVEVECGESAIYIGKVDGIDTKLQQISLIETSLNGKTLPSSVVTIKATEIQNLSILSQPVTKKKESVEKVVKSEKSKMKERKDIKDTTYKGSPEVQAKKNIKQVERQSKKQKGNKASSIAFESEELDADFDFEGNLALFNKEAVFNEIKESIIQGLSKSVVRNFKGNENVLESEPVSLRQIKVPLEHVGKEYTTDSGFIVPAISSELRKKVFAQAEMAGLSVTQRVENAGICTCQMALQLVGGERRMCPRNAHQPPEIVILASPNVEGLQAIAAARHLANHAANVTLYVPEVRSIVRPQLDLFSKTEGRLITRVEHLPSQPVDLVVDTLSSNESSEFQYSALLPVVDWANRNKAPVLALDPCIRSKQVNLVIKWSIALGLPLISCSKSGRLYLADVGIPSGVFNDVGISYKSPFTDKFVIPLYD